MKPAKHFLYNIAIFFIAMLIGLPSYGMAAGYSKEVVDNTGVVTKDTVGAKLREIKTAYESRNIIPMMALLDKEFPNALEFKASLTDQTLSAKSQEIVFVQDSFLIDKDKVLVKLHWRKKYFTSSGAFRKATGESRFIFRLIDNDLKLLQIKGDNPFL